MATGYKRQEWIYPNQRTTLVPRDQGRCKYVMDATARRSDNPINMSAVLPNGESIGEAGSSCVPESLDSSSPVC